MIKQRLPLFLAALWWGSLTTVGFIVVPLLFATLPSPAIAGATAAKLFNAQTWLSMACAIILLLFTRSKTPDEQTPVAQAALLFIAGGLLLALLAEFAVAPRIVARGEFEALAQRGQRHVFAAVAVCRGDALEIKSRTTALMVLAGG